MRLALVGTGRMGTAVAAAALEAGHEVAARLGRPALSAGPATVAEALEGADVAVDFTHADAVGTTVAGAARARVALVTGTTGWAADSDGILTPARDAGIGVVHGPNFSVGVHLFLALVREAARGIDALAASGAAGYDAHVHESHHRHKKDAPSGTARVLAEALVAEMGDKDGWKAPVPGSPPDPRTLLVTSTRAGEIAGEHLVGLEGPDDRIRLRHEAKGRGGFARGALMAAAWIRKRTGVHTFEEVVADLLARR